MSYSSDRPPPGSAAYGQPQWNPAWGNPAWNSAGGWRPNWEPGPFLSDLLAFRPFRIVMVVLAFILWWPIGLATLLFMIWSRRMGCWTYGRRADRNAGPDDRGQGPWRGAPWARWCGGERAAPTSGNRAFDEYRTETLRRLEEEQAEFAAFVDRLRFARDKSEFDQFMADRRQRPTGSEPPPEPAAG